LSAGEVGREWATHGDLVGELRRLWDRGAIAAEAAGGPPVFPYRLRLRRPKTADLMTRYDDARRWVRDLSALPGVRLEWSTVGSRTVGRNDLPSQAWVDDIDTACAMLGTTDDLALLRSVVAATTSRMPALATWLVGHGLDAIAFAHRWADLLAVVDYIVSHQPLDLYVRQLDLPGVNTKFIENHRVVLGSMLDAVLPHTAVDGRVTAAASFATRYGFRLPAPTVTLRSLDPSHPPCLTSGQPIAVADRIVTITVDDFADLSGVKQVFVTENYVNFLAFPPLTGADAIVVFGQGFDVGKLARAPWLQQVPVHYWGDIDTYGFAILDHFRSLVPHVRSMLMDRDTLLRHEAQWVTEHAQERRDLTNLTSIECALYDDLRDNRVGNRVRLEQELIDYAWVTDAVRRHPHGKG
jgi:hypothetical protein